MAKKIKVRRGSTKSTYKTSARVMVPLKTLKNG